MKKRKDKLPKVTCLGASAFLGAKLGEPTFSEALHQIKEEIQTCIVSYRDWPDNVVRDTDWIRQILRLQKALKLLEAIPRKGRNGSSA